MLGSEKVPIDVAVEGHYIRLGRAYDKRIEFVAAEI
jgi:hypothetical protein